MRVAAAQDAPVFLDRRATTERVIGWIDEASREGVEVLAFAEAYLPGYPFWLSRRGGARFDDADQKEVYRRYLEAAVRLDGDELREIAAASRSRGIFVVLGVVERGPGPGAGSVYCTLVPIDPVKGILTAHRKLVPTYEERLVWAQGDGAGLRGHDFAGARIGALNCWENWMPLARHTMYATGEDLHVAVWPGSVRNTADITRFVAREGRVFVLSASALLRLDDLPGDFPLARSPEEEDWIHDGGSAIAGPDGAWIVEPQAHRRGLVIADLDLAQVARERQNFDPTGHYSRPDVFHLEIDRRRRLAAHFEDEPENR